MSNEITMAGGGVLGTRLQEIEWEIQYHVKRAAGHLLDVGRCLNEAKDEGLVPHGQWQEWVQSNTGMSVRGAQRVMQAAREVPKASTLSHLEFSKVQALLALPAAEREAFAEDVGADDMSVRELQAAVKAKQDAEAEGEKLRAQAAAKQREIERLEQVASNATASAVSYSNELDKAREQLLEARNAAAITPAAQAEIDRLQAEIDAQEGEIERQAKARADAQQELLRLRTELARGNAPTQCGDTLTPDELGAAARAFIGRAAAFPHMGVQIAGVDARKRESYRQSIAMVADWCERAQAAMNIVEGGIICD